MPGMTHPSVIRVNMVSLPAKGTTVRATRPPASKRTAEKAKKTQGVSLKTASTAPIKKTKSAAGKKPVTPEEKVKNAIEQIEDKAETSRPKEVTDAIESIRSKVKEDEANRVAIQNSDEELTGTVGVESGVEGGSGIGGNSPLDILTLYRDEIADIVQKNWAYSESLAGAKPDLQTKLVFEVLPNGDIKDIWFTEKSGNTYLDESAYKAVMKSKPFPPFPLELSRPVVDVPLRFTPKGLNK